MANKRLMTSIPLPYATLTRMLTIVADIRQLLSEHEGIDQTLTTTVDYDDFSGPYLYIHLSCYSKTRDWQQFQELKEQLKATISAIIQQQGVDFFGSEHELFWRW